MKIIKRNGQEENFNKDKIIKAVMAAMLDVNKVNTHIAEAIAETLSSMFLYNTVDVEQIQDAVETELMKCGQFETAKAYILYRSQHADMRANKWLDEVQYDIWNKKYRNKNESYESWLGRVSNGSIPIANIIRNTLGAFAGRILANRGLNKYGKKVTYSNCYVLPAPEDNLESIFDTAKYAARVYSYGGGVGLDLSNLRPKGMRVNNSAKETSGAVSFMSLYNLTTDIIGQNGRRGAMMMSMDVKHPDVEEFVKIKTDLNLINKSNLSIFVDGEFIDAAQCDSEYVQSFYCKDTHQTYKKTISANDLMHTIAKVNWDYAEPGMLFRDNIDRWHLQAAHPEYKIAGVNPCAEEPLIAWGACLLGSVNLSKFVINPFEDDATIDYDLLSEIVIQQVIALNDVLDEGIDMHPISEQSTSASKWRQIGLGVMGFADMLIKLGIKYDSIEAVNVSRELSNFMLNEALKTSASLAKTKGSYPMFDIDIIEESAFFKSQVNAATKTMIRKYGLYNAQIMSIAPTGTISNMFGVSGGIEPLFATQYTRKTESLHGVDKTYTIYPYIIKEYMQHHNITKLTDLPPFIITAKQIRWEDRLNIQAAWQTNVDAAISSTVNLPSSASVEDIINIYQTAYMLGLKGVTVYREGCKRDGILNTIPTCPECGAEIIVQEGCKKCASCSYAVCTI